MQFKNVSNISLFSLGKILLDKKSQIISLSNPSTTNRNTPSSILSLIIFSLINKSKHSLYFF